MASTDRASWVPYNCAILLGDGEVVDRVVYAPAFDWSAVRDRIEATGQRVVRAVRCGGGE